MRKAKAEYIQPEIITLGSDEIVRLVGPVQGYGITGGNGADLSEELLSPGAGTRNINQP
jgi:hypothetical protein